MIRELQEKDLERAMEIWLDTNIKAHGFISSQYWKDHAKTVREMIPRAEVYVYEEEGGGSILGFIGMSGEYIAGIFVCEKRQRSGIGRQLIEFAKTLKGKLTLNVYEKNHRAVKFYTGQNFQIVTVDYDKDTGEKEYFMKWER